MPTAVKENLGNPFEFHKVIVCSNPLMLLDNKDSILSKEILYWSHRFVIFFYLLNHLFFLYKKAVNEFGVLYAFSESS